MNASPSLSRRAFLRDAALGGLAAMGWPPKLGWAVEPTRARHSLKLVFFTDVHDRVDWHYHAYGWSARRPARA